MKRLLSHLVVRVKEAWNRPTARRERFTRPSLEGLEDRLALSTLYVIPGLGQNNGAAFSSFGNAYGAARPGDTIQLEPGASLPNNLTIGKQLTIQGDPRYSANNFPVNGTVGVTQGGSHTIFNNLDFTRTWLTIDSNTNSVTVENSLLGTAIFQGSGNNIENNTIQGYLFVYGGFATYTDNWVGYNRFTGQGHLEMIGGAYDVVVNNTFQTSSRSAIGIAGDSYVWVGSNTISFTNPSDENIGIALENIVNVGDVGYSRGSYVHLTDNQIHTGNRGVGLEIIKDLSSNLQVNAEGNNFSSNATGVFIFGDGKSAGTIDLGGGLLHSSGGNDFSDYHGGDGRLAIALAHTYNSAIVWAEHEDWGTYPPKVIKDSSDNSNQPATASWSYGNYTGAGWVYWYNN